MQNLEPGLARSPLRHKVNVGPSADMPFGPDFVKGCSYSGLRDIWSRSWVKVVSDIIVFLKAHP